MSDEKPTTREALVLFGMTPVPDGYLDRDVIEVLFDAVAKWADLEAAVADGGRVVVEQRRCIHGFWDTHRSGGEDYFCSGSYRRIILGEGRVSGQEGERMSDLTEALPTIGSMWVWEPLRPHATELIEVEETKWFGEGWWVKSRCVDRREGHWNELSRWVEATVFVAEDEIETVKARLDAARKWAELEALVADGGRVVVEEDCVDRHILGCCDNGLHRRIILGEGATE